MAKIQVTAEGVEMALDVAGPDLGKAVQQLAHVMTIADRMRELRVFGEIVLTFAAKEEEQ